MQKSIFTFCLFCSIVLMSCSNSEDNSIDDSLDTKESTIDLEELEKSDQHKADSVKKHWQDKMKKS